MGVLSNNYAQIVPGALISASYVSDIYDVLMGTEREDIMLSGSLNITGSTNLQGVDGTIFSIHGTTGEVFSVTDDSTGDLLIISSGSNDLFIVSSSGDVTITGSITINNVVTVVNDEFIVSGSILFYTASLPTTDPELNGQLWRSGSFLMISTGSGI